MTNEEAIKWLDAEIHRAEYINAMWLDCVQVEPLMQIRELLTAQQPRVLTEEDFIDNPLVDNNGNVPAWCEHRVFNGIAHDVDGWTAINQRWVCGFRTQRYWTARPTEEQSQAVKWE